MPLFGRKDKEKKKAEKQRGNAQGASPVHRRLGVEDKRRPVSVSYDLDRDSASNSPTPSGSTQELRAGNGNGSPGRAVVVPKKQASSTLPHEFTRGGSSTSVAKTRAFFEAKSENPSPARHQMSGDSRSGSVSISSPVSATSPTRGGGRSPSSPSYRSVSQTPSGISGVSSEQGSQTSLQHRTYAMQPPVLTLPSNADSMDLGLDGYFSGPGLEMRKEKTLNNSVELPLPPLQTTRVRHRSVIAQKNAPGGGFGFILRKSYLPVPEDPEKTRLVHLVEPRSDYFGPLMTGDRIIEVNSQNVEDAPHETVVEMIISSGDSVELLVASMPELLELNSRGALDDPLHAKQHNLRKSGKGMKPGSTGTLRKKANVRKAFKAKSAEEVLSEREGLAQVFVVHKEGFTLGTLVQDKKGSALSAHVGFVRNQGRETYRVKLQYSGEVFDVDEDDIEKANLATQDKVEDLVDLVHLNESSMLHVLRQRYGSSLIHTFAGRHLIIMNPLRPLSSYVDRVIDMFRGCRREDMPPHIFAAGQQAYRDMMVTRGDQSLILLGLSGSGKTFNARYLLRYLTTVGQQERATVSNAKLDAVELLLHSFSSAATHLNPQATRCACLYSLDFDPSGSVVGASVRTFLLERMRVAQRSRSEGNFNIFYQLVAGGDEQLKSELLLNAPVGKDDSNLYFEPHDDPQRAESAAVVWDLIQNCLEILGISQEEALGLWSLLAAIYHLGFASVKKGTVRGSDCFLNPAAAQRAATVLGINHEDLGRDIFSPPRGASLRLSNLFSSPSTTPSPSETSSIHGSPFLAGFSPSAGRSASLDAFIMGLYDQAFNALVMLMNRALQAHVGSKARSTIHVLDTPGFQHRELAGARDGGSFDDLCMNYSQERLQMLFHDSTFTLEQDRYIQENINITWMFSEVTVSPLAVIDTIDKHVPQRRGGAIDVHTDRRGLLWILDEESVFPGGSDSSFLERVHMYHGEPNERGEPLLKVLKDENRFTIFHCQRSLPVLYNSDGWVRRAREHPSFRVVVQVVAESKRPSIGSIFQGRGVAASATNIGSSALKVDTHQTLQRTRSSQPYSSPAASIKKSSVCLQPKFQLDVLIDTLRKTRQWFIRCILPQPPSKLPGALPSPDPQDQLGGAGHTLHGHMDIPLVRDQLRRADLVKAARIYKQGFPEHMSFPEFRRRYGALLPVEYPDSPQGDPETVNLILKTQEVDKHSFRIGLSQVFFRAGTLSHLDRQVEERTHDTMVLFQAHCRGWLGREKARRMEVQHSAAWVIQQNVLAFFEYRDWVWWKVYTKVKPMLAVWRAEEEIRDRDDQIGKLKEKGEKLEDERDMLKDSERVLEEKVAQLSAELSEVQLSANHATELLENEQLEKRQLEEQLSDIALRETELAREREQLQLQIAEASILVRLRQSDEGEEGGEGAVLEKYYEARRELETLRQKISMEYEDEIEQLTDSKRSLEKKLADSEGEVDDLHRTLTQVRKKATKLGSELNDLKLHLESQQARNAELEKRQRKFDADLNAAKEEATNEELAKSKLAMEKDTLQTDFAELQQKYKELEEENLRVRQEKEDLESEILSHTSTSAEGELSSLRRMKRELGTKVEELEDELDEATAKLDTVQQSKARLELANQTLRQQHQKELETRDEELEEVKNTTSKKVKAMSEQLEQLHEEKHTLVKTLRDKDRELQEFRDKGGDIEAEKKLRKAVKKYKTLVEDLQGELEHEREMRSNSAMVKSLRNQLEDLQASEITAVKAQKRMQGELEELQVQCDEQTRAKIELERTVTELGREKEDLETRLEEDQDEVDDLLSKQRTHITQMSALQGQLGEARAEVEELQEAKVALENKVADVMLKMQEVESGVNRHQYEASELKVRELEQKLELERSSARRHEAQLNRLRSQLERLQEEKTEDVSAKNNDALKRMQKQMRELRAQLQEAERREQDQNKKRRAAEARVEEVEAQVLTSQADLKSAQKRIETLHTALKGQEEELSGLEDEEYSLDQRDRLEDDDDDISSSESYQIGDFVGSTDDFLSDEDDEFATTHIAAKRRRKKREELAAANLRLSGDEDDDDLEFTSRGRGLDVKLSEDDDDTFTRRKKLSDEEQEFSSRRKTDYKSKFSDEEEFSTRRKKDYGSKFSDEEEFGTRRKKDYGSKFSDEEEFGTRRKKDYGSKFSDEGEFSTRRKKDYGLSDEDEFSSRTKREYGDDLTSSHRREVVKLSDDDNDDNLLTGSKKAPDQSREQSAEPGEDVGTSSQAKRRRRSRMRLEDEDRNLIRQADEREEPKVSDSETGKSEATTGKLQDEESEIRWGRRDDTEYNRKSASKLADQLGEEELTGAHSGLKLNGTSEITSPLHRSNGTKLSSEEPLSPHEGSADIASERRPSIDIVTDEQQQVYKASRNRRRRRQRTIEADIQIHVNPDTASNPETNGVS